MSMKEMKTLTIGDVQYKIVDGTIGSLDELNTENKASVVAAINEVVANSNTVDYTETDPTVPAWAKASTKPTYTASEVGALPDTTVIPTVPTKVSAFANDIGYLTRHQDVSGKADKNAMTLGIHTDGLVYLFIDGSPVGTGIELSSGGISGYVDSENNIIINGLPDGSYTVKYEMDDGSFIDIGDLVLDTNVYYTIANTLTNCTNSNRAVEIAEGENYSATITANSGCELKSVSVTMGGSAVQVSGGVIDIANVTGNIVITAVAEESAVAPSYTNLLPLAVDADGNPYVGTNGEKGYKAGYKMSGSSGNETAVVGAYCTGFMPVTATDRIRIKNVAIHSGDNTNNVIFYDENKVKVYSATNGTSNGFNEAVSMEGDTYTLRASGFTAATNIAFFRFSCGGITDDTIVTVNEEISSESSGYTNLANPNDTYWQTDHRLSISSGGASACAGRTVTNFIPAKSGDVLRVKGMYIADKEINSQACKIVLYSKKDDTSSKLTGLFGYNTTNQNEGYGTNVTVNGDTSTITILLDNVDDIQRAPSNTEYLRIDGVLMEGYTANDVIITINEPIE